MSATKRAHEAAQEHPAAGVDHPFTKKPLSAFESITAVCGDCGHTAVLDRDKLLSMAAVPDFGTLWRHAYCAECRAEGSPRRNVVLHPLLRETAVPATEVAWSRKPVFGEDRSDPFPGLPRRRLAEGV